MSLDEAWHFYSNPKNLSKITPAKMGFNITSETADKMYVGQIISYKVSPLFGINLNWVTEITHINAKMFFVDEHRFGPYTMWHHENLFLKSGDQVEMTDKVSFKVPLGFLGRLFVPILVKPQLKKIFNYRIKIIEEKFNKVVADLVDGVSKLDKLSISSRTAGEAENLQKMVLAMSQDIRVIVVKLADRLHNMRTLLYLSREKQVKIAKETLEIYAPIAHRIGMNNVYRELEDLAFKGHEFPQLILEWRQVSKLKNTYSDSLPEHINPTTKRVHTSFLLAATTTGRLASSDPNLQNIPIKSEDGKDIRKAFAAKKDHLLISADYNQIEMRILADLADVKELKKAFKNNEDIHSLTASQIFNIDIKKVNQDHRRKAKAINFGIIYGISQYGLAKQINVSNYEAEEFLDAYFAKFPEIKIYMDSTIKFCRKSGYVNNIFGRRSHFNGINDKNFNVRNFQERAAINAPIQGSASEIMRLAMIRLDKKLSDQKNIKSKMLLQIHDELIFEVPKKDEKIMIKLIKEEMTSVAQSDYHSFSTPLTVDVNVGDNWGMLH